MKALVKAKAEPGIWMQDVPKPECGRHDALIKVKKTGICGTDIHIYHWDAWSQQNVPVPMTIGHEFYGEVVEVGDAVEGIKPGDRVSGEGHFVCGTCRKCRTGKQHLCKHTLGLGVHRPGAFAEYVVLPASNVFVLPDDIEGDLGAVFDPFGNAVHSAFSFDLVGKDVLITGAGPIGIMCVAIARFVGARHVVITDVNAYRLDLARKMGASYALDVSKGNLKDVMQSLSMQEGFDVGLEMSGHPDAMQDMLASMNHGGVMALLGILPEETAINWHDVIFKGLQLKGIYGREMYETWYQMVSLVQGGLNISPVITHHFAADDYEKAFQVMASGDSGKVILEWE